MPKLIRLGLAPHGLEVELLRDPPVDVDVVASAHPIELESASLHKALEFVERDVLQFASAQSLEKLRRLHSPHGNHRV